MEEIQRMGALLGDEEVPVLSFDNFLRPEYLAGLRDLCGPKIEREYEPI